MGMRAALSPVSSFSFRRSARLVARSGPPDSIRGAAVRAATADPGTSGACVTSSAWLPPTRRPSIWTRGSTNLEVQMFERGVVNKVTYSDSWIDECGLGHACGRGRALARRRAGVGLGWASASASSGSGRIEMPSARVISRRADPTNIETLHSLEIDHCWQQRQHATAHAPHR